MIQTCNIIKMKPVVILLILFAILSCNKDHEISPANINDKFELPAASGWVLINEQGIDTYVGYYKKGKYEIHFDFGFMSFGDIDNIKDTHDLLYYEELTINGDRAKIIKSSTGTGTVLSAFIDKGDGKNKNRLYTFNTSDPVFMEIVKSHKFK